MGQTERRLRAVRLCGVGGAAPVIPSVRRTIPLAECRGHKFHGSHHPVLLPLRSHPPAVESRESPLESHEGRGSFFCRVSGSFNRIIKITF